MRPGGGRGRCTAAWHINISTSHDRNVRIGATTNLDAPRATARKRVIARAWDVAVLGRCSLDDIRETSPAVALVPELDSGVAEALCGARHDARCGCVVDRLGCDVARDDPRRVVDGAEGERSPVERDSGRLECVHEAREEEDREECKDGGGERGWHFANVEMGSRDECRGFCSGA